MAWKVNVKDELRINVSGNDPAPFVVPKGESLVPAVVAEFVVANKLGKAEEVPDPEPEAPAPDPNAGELEKLTAALEEANQGWAAEKDRAEKAEAEVATLKERAEKAEAERDVAVSAAEELRQANEALKSEKPTDAAPDKPDAGEKAQETGKPGK